MKKILMVVALMATVAMFAKAESFVYSTYAGTGTLSATPVGQPGNTLMISGVVRLKQVVVHNSTGAAQTVTLYKNFTSTTAATAVDTWVIPATVGMTFPWGSDVISSALGNFDIVNCPNLSVKTDAANADKVRVSFIYGK